MAKKVIGNRDICTCLAPRTGLLSHVSQFYSLRSQLWKSLQGSRDTACALERAKAMEVTAVRAEGCTAVYVTLFGSSDRLGSGRGNERRIFPSDHDQYLML